MQDGKLKDDELTRRRLRLRSDPLWAANEPSGIDMPIPARAEREVDLIFIHGLGSSSRSPWTDGRSPHNFWPREAIPYARWYTRGLRVLTYGYEARDIHQDEGALVSVLDAAKTMLHDFKHAKDQYSSTGEPLGLGEKPIIFLAHSFGGLVFKEAYIRGTSDPEYADIMNAVTSVVFFATPHSTSATQLAQDLDRVVKVSFSPMRALPAAELERAAQRLQEVNASFAQMTGKLQVVSLYETQPTAMIEEDISVLDKGSSVIGCEGEIVKPMNADHRKIGKLPSGDESSRTVGEILSNLVSRARDGGTT